MILFFINFFILIQKSGLQRDFVATLLTVEIHGYGCYSIAERVELEKIAKI